LRGNAATTPTVVVASCATLEAARRGVRRARVRTDINVRMVAVQGRAPLAAVGWKTAGGNRRLLKSVGGRYPVTLACMGIRNNVMSPSATQIRVPRSLAERAGVGQATIARQAIRAREGTAPSTRFAPQISSVHKVLSVGGGDVHSPAACQVAIRTGIPMTMRFASRVV
jgi:hypothetical protein